jgi:hypothetical protein
MKTKKTDEEMIRIFWEAHPDSFFSEKTVALIRNLATSTIQKERWDKSGPKFVKVLGKVLYKKSDVIDFIDGFKE